MSSGSNAGKNGGTPRERFSSLPVAMGIALSFLLLLLVLFPEKKIMREIDETSDPSPLLLDYRQSVLRLRPADAGLRLKLAEDLVKAGLYGRALQTLDGFGSVPEKGNRNRYLHDRCRALAGIISSLKSGAPDLKRARDDFSATVRELAAGGASPEQLLSLAREAGNVGDRKSARYLMRKFVISTAVSDGLADLSVAAAAPSGAGRYREDSDMYFSAMGDARSQEARRALFMKGVRCLQAGGLPAEALAEGERHLGVLGTDRRTLLFMANVALAADRPPVAQYYVKKALGMEAVSESSEVRQCAHS